MTEYTKTKDVRYLLARGETPAYSPTQQAYARQFAYAGLIAPALQWRDGSTRAYRVEIEANEDGDGVSVYAGPEDHPDWPTIWMTWEYALHWTVDYLMHRLTDTQEKLLREMVKRS
jgi:hypothetical protein